MESATKPKDIPESANKEPLTHQAAAAPLKDAAPSSTPKPPPPPQPNRSLAAHRAAANPTSSISGIASAVSGSGSGGGGGGAGNKEDEEDRGSIVSLDSDSTNGPLFWFRVVSKVAPKARNCHTATMVGDTMLVFGGFGGSKRFDDIWSFDAHHTEWHQPELQRSADGVPPARYAHSAVSFRGLLYMFGGYGGAADGWLGDLWVLDTQQIRVRDHAKAKMKWSKPETTGPQPSPRAAHSATIVGNRLYIFGGNNGDERLNDMHSLDTQTMAWRVDHCTGQIPSPRAGHTATLLEPAAAPSGGSGGGGGGGGGGAGGGGGGGGGAGEARLLVFAGGDITTVFNDLHLLHVDSLQWTRPQATGPPPSPRAGHCACVLPDGSVLVWGGGSVGRVLNDMHVLDTATMNWSGAIELKYSPEPRVGHTICMYGSDMFVFGGGDSRTIFGDLTFLDTQALLDHNGIRRAAKDNDPSAASADYPSSPAVSNRSTLVAADRSSQVSEAKHWAAFSPPPAEELLRSAAAPTSGKELTWQHSKGGDGDRDGAAAAVSAPHSATAHAEGHRGVKSGMKEEHRILARKIINRPSKEALVQQNILKDDSSVTPNILAAQQRLLKRRANSALEMKLGRRPHMNQLVMTKIIPEEHEYVEHEHRLWGHVQAEDTSLHPDPPSAPPPPAAKPRSKWAGSTADPPHYPATVHHYPAGAAHLPPLPHGAGGVGGHSTSQGGWRRGGSGADGADGGNGRGHSDELERVLHRVHQGLRDAATAAAALVLEVQGPDGDGHAAGHHPIPNYGSHTAAGGAAADRMAVLRWNLEDACARIESIISSSPPPSGGGGGHAGGADERPRWRAPAPPAVTSDSEGEAGRAREARRAGKGSGAAAQGGDVRRPGTLCPAPPPWPIAEPAARKQRAPAPAAVTVQQASDMTQAVRRDSCDGVEAASVNNQEPTHAHFGEKSSAAGATSEAPSKPADQGKECNDAVGLRSQVGTLDCCRPLSGSANLSVGPGDGDEPAGEGLSSQSDSGAVPDGGAPRRSDPGAPAGLNPPARTTVTPSEANSPAISKEKFGLGSEECRLGLDREPLAGENAADGLNMDGPILLSRHRSGLGPELGGAYESAGPRAWTPDSAAEEFFVAQPAPEPIDQHYARHSAGGAGAYPPAGADADGRWYGRWDRPPTNGPASATAAAAGCPRDGAQWVPSGGRADGPAVTRQEAVQSLIIEMDRLRHSLAIKERMRDVIHNGQCLHCFPEFGRGSAAAAAIAAAAAAGLNPHTAHRTRTASPPAEHSDQRRGTVTGGSSHCDSQQSNTADTAESRNVEKPTFGDDDGDGGVATHPPSCGGGGGGPEATDEEYGGWAGEAARWWLPDICRAYLCPSCRGCAPQQERHGARKRRPGKRPHRRKGGKKVGAGLAGPGGPGAHSPLDSSVATDDSGGEEDPSAGAGAGVSGAPSIGGGKVEECGLGAGRGQRAQSPRPWGEPSASPDHHVQASRRGQVAAAASSYPYRAADHSRGRDTSPSSEGSGRGGGGAGGRRGRQAHGRSFSSDVELEQCATGCADFLPL